MTAYYNEIDPQAAAWLRNLIAAGHIAPGVVDERSIEDVLPDELRGFTQCHFFAGVGVWSFALRHSGWSDDRPVWTGSCPCQPFSAAGKGAGFADERHLWPAFAHLIAECKPATVLGEQVASSAVDAWIDLVHADLEAMDYAFGSVPFPSAGVGAPHIRDRNYWVAQSSSQRRQRGKGAAHGGITNWDDAGRLEGNNGVTGIGETRVRLADPARPGPQCECGNGGESARCAEGCSAGGLADLPGQRRGGRAADTGKPARRGSAENDGASGWLADAADIGWIGRRASSAGDGRNASRLEPERLCDAGDRPGPTNGYWRDADWLGCRDGKFRPVEPGTFPLAHGATNRVGRLRAYGNAINAEAAKAWIETVMECLP